MAKAKEQPEKKEYEVGNKKPPKAHQFKPGQSGNPAGKPKGTFTLTAILREQLEKDNGKLAKELIADAIAKSREGNGAIFKIIYDRMDGVQKAELDLTSGNQPIKALIGVDIDEV